MHMMFLDVSGNSQYERSPLSVAVLLFLRRHPDLRLPRWPALMSLLSQQQPVTVSVLAPALESVIKFQHCCHGRFFFAMKEFKLRGHLPCFSGTTIITLALETRFTNHQSMLLGGLGQVAEHAIFLVCWNESLVASNCTPPTSYLPQPHTILSAIHLERLTFDFEAGLGLQGHLVHFHHLLNEGNETQNN